MSKFFFYVIKAALQLYDVTDPNGSTKGILTRVSFLVRRRGKNSIDHIQIENYLDWFQHLMLLAERKKLRQKRILCLSFSSLRWMDNFKIIPTGIRDDEIMYTEESSDL